VGGTPEILTDWLSRYLVEPGDSEGLARQLGELEQWREREPDLGTRCRLAAEARLSLDDELDTIEKAMRVALSAAHRRRWRASSANEARSCG
jgi:hypothetical protein